MAIVAKLVVEQTIEVIPNNPFYGNIRKFVKNEETLVIDKAENVTLPKFDKVQILFSLNGDSYKVTIDKHIFDYYDGNDSFVCQFFNNYGNLFEFSIFDDGTTQLLQYETREDYNDGVGDVTISDTAVLYNDDILV